MLLFVVKVKIKLKEMTRSTYFKILKIFLKDLFLKRFLKRFFRFTVKLSGRYTDSPHALCPHAWAPPLLASPTREVYLFYFFMLY